MSIDTTGLPSVTITYAPAPSAAPPSAAPPASAPPSIAQIEASLRAQLIPSGPAARIAAILRNHGFSVVLKALVAGSATIKWYSLPRGAHIASARPILIAQGSIAFQRAGTGRLTIHLTSKGAQLLKTVRSVKLSVTGIFKPSGGSPIPIARTFTLRR